MQASSAFVIALCIAVCHAAGLPRVPPTGVTMKSYGTSKMIPSSSLAIGNTSTPTTLDDIQDALYTIDISIGGQNFKVQFDTGSSDLWVFSGATSINITNSTDLNATLEYGRGSVNGTILFADVAFGGYNIPSQAFIKASALEDFAFIDEGVSGILGIGFDDDKDSGINSALREAYGQEFDLAHIPILNIFKQNPNTPNSFDIRLDRSEDLDNSSTGTFLIGEHLPGFEQVAQQPQLSRVVPGRWAVPLDSMTVNGQAITLPPSNLPEMKSQSKLGVLVDSGSSSALLPDALVDAIYTQIPGSMLFAKSGLVQYILPCTTAANVSFTFGGVQIPIHPLDLIGTQAIKVTQNGVSTNITVCLNNYQYSPLDPADFDNLDGIMGDIFLCNAYASFNYGDMASLGNNSFIQLLPITEQAAAWAEFAEVRPKSLASMPSAPEPATVFKLLADTYGSGGQGINDTAIDSESVASGALESVSESTDKGSDDKVPDSWLKKHGIIIIGLLAGNVVVGLLLCIIALVACMRGVFRGSARTKNIGSSYVPVKLREAEGSSIPEPEYHD